MQQSLPQTQATFGLAGFLLAAISLLIIVIQISTYLEPPAKSSGTVIGEIAADIKLSAKRALTGEPAPEPTPPPRDKGPLITNIALALAGLAMVLGGIGLYRREPQRLSYMAIGLGILACTAQYVFILAILAIGAALLIAILHNLKDITG